MPLDNSAPERSPRIPARPARWCTHEFDGSVCLQIELPGDFGITLTCHPDEPPSVALWRGSGERRFNKGDSDHGFTPDLFRQWIEEVTR